MKFLKEISGRIWAAWGLILFAVTLLLFMIPFTIISFKPEPKRTRLFIRFSRAWMDIFLNGIGCHLTVIGKEHFKTGKNYIVVCNHNSLMDVPVSCPYIPGGNKTIAKVEITKVPVFGTVYKMGSVLVDRKSEKSRRESYQQMKEVLKMGLHMAIYPEGTRNKTNDPIKSFQDGAFKLAMETQTPIIPTLIFNTATVLPSEKPFFLWPHALSMHFLPPVEIVEGDKPATLKEKVHKIMSEYYVAHR